MRNLKLCWVLLAFAAIATTLCAQVPNNVWNRVRLLRIGNATASAFTIEVDGRQYLITAKHFVARVQPEASIEVYRAGQFEPLHFRIFVCDSPVDIAVLVPPHILSKAFPLEPSKSDIAFGQDTYFLGFPYGWEFNDQPQSVNDLYPFPFVKRALLSRIVDDHGATKIILDGYNNFGYSGGPIVFQDLRRKNSPFKVAGVISGFYPDLVHVTKPEKVRPGEDVTRVESWRISKHSNGDVYQLKDTDEQVPLNVGIIFGYDIAYAVELIRKHPLGPKVPQ